MSTDVFADVIDLLYGGGGDDLIVKMNPTQSDISARKKSERTQARVGLASNVVGLGAGIGGTAAALRDDRFAEGGKWAKKLHGHAKKIPSPISSKTGKAGAMLAGGALGLQVANIGGDVVANRVLARSAKKPEKVKKDIAEIAETAGSPKQVLTRAAITNAPRAKGAGLETKRKVGGVLRRLPNKPVSSKVGKRDDRVDVLWSGEIAKANEEKQQIFGWASVVEVNGEPVVDLQGDYISIEEMEKAGYSYVQKSRKGGDMHLRDEWQPIQKSEMIESFIVTPEKREALGLPDSVPSGWWVGFQVRDPDVWSKVRSGERTGFSIHGTGKRAPS